MIHRAKCILTSKFRKSKIVLTVHSLAVTLCTTSFNFQMFYMVLTLRLCVIYGSQNVFCPINY